MLGLLRGGGLPTASAQSTDTVTLQPGRRAARDLEKGRTDRYRITLPADAWIEMRVEQQGIRIGLKVSDADDAVLLEARGAPLRDQETTLTLITRAAGVHRIEIHPDEAESGGGRYALTLSAPRPPTADERQLEEARVQLAASADLVRRGQYEAALAPAQQALALREKVLGADHPLVADALHALAVDYDNKAEYKLAEPINLRALAIRERAFGPDHPDVAASLYNLAWIYLVRQDYVRAEQTYQRVLAIQQHAFGPDSRITTSTLNDLAILYHRQAHYDKAAEIDERVLAIREKTFGPEDRGVARSLGNLGLDYLKKGDFVRAEARLVRALQIYEKTAGPDHPDTANTLNNLALVYADKGDYAAAEPLHLRALAIREKRLGPDHPDVAADVNNLAWLYQHEGEYAKARPLFVRALAIREKALGPTHSDVGESLNNLAALELASRAGADEVEPLLRRSQAILEQALGPEHDKVATPISHLAKVAFERRDYATAEREYLRALSIRERAVGADHPTIIDILRGVAQVYRATGDTARSLAAWTRYTDTVERNVERNLPVGSERQKRSYLRLFGDDVNDVLSVEREAGNDAALDLAFTTVLRSKGRALDAMTDSVRLLRGRANPEDRALFDSLAGARTRLAALTLRGPDRDSAQAYKASLADVERDVEGLERALSAKSAEFRSRVVPVTLSAVRSSLPAGGALIEFVQYRPTSVNGISEPPRYTALVLAGTAPPFRIELGEASAVDHAIGQWRLALRDPRRPDAHELGRQLDELVMQPVRARLGAVRHLVISPDGQLNLVPFAALVDEQGAYLLERFSITYVTSGRDLLRLAVARPSLSAAVVIADPAFGDPAVRARPAGTAVAAGSPARFGVDYSQMFFGPLPGAAAELRALRAVLPEATFLTKDAATKPALMAVRGPRILHIATHGFFLEDAPAPDAGAAGSKRVGRIAGHVENPLVRSGLALAGANRGQDGAADGVLTALEAADLDLWGTRLVVLSACDTGVGEIRAGEGVYGLRRALVVAGAESQMMSLWPVPDRGTRDVIVAYYKNLLRGVGRGEALRLAQLQMMRDRLQTHPFYWAGFILSGQWAALDSDR